jgi:hypothetical protein
MPTFKKGEIFESDCYIIATTCSFLTSENKLVMRDGAAWKLKMKVPGIDHELGKMIFQTCGHLGRFGLLIYRSYGALQVKYRFDEKPSLELIQLSLEKLSDLAKKCPHLLFNIDYPGIEDGGLNKVDVLPLLNILPENVYVWEKE